MELISDAAVAGLGSRHESVDTRQTLPLTDSNTDHIGRNDVVGGIAQVGLRRAPLFRPRDPSN
jgi:hypothetical protein